MTQRNLARFSASPGQRLAADIRCALPYVAEIISGLLFMGGALILLPILAAMFM